MELKRILAKDIKAANDKAVALYGPDVLVISSARVRGQTELIVAVDIPELNAEQALAEQIEITPKKYERRIDATFSDVLAQEIQEAKPLRQQAAVQGAALKAAPASKKPAFAADELSRHQEALRGQEIVSLVREELASLRREFKISQQLALQQGPVLHESLEPLQLALQEAAMPVGLRALLIDALKDSTSLESGVAVLSHMLKSAIDREKSEWPKAGIHAVGGLSGSGKSSMVARWASQASADWGCENVLVISHMDHRAGAWNQTQLLCSQSGVNCVRSTNPGMLRLLLDEHAHCKLILIDTPGMGIKERFDEILSAHPDVQAHAVIMADASQVSMAKVLQSGVNWQGLFISKLDESEQPWALIQMLSENPISIHAASHGERLSDWQRPFAVSALVNQAIDRLPIVQSKSDGAMMIHPSPTHSMATSRA